MFIAAAPTINARKTSEKNGGDARALRARTNTHLNTRTGIHNRRRDLVWVSSLLLVSFRDRGCCCSAACYIQIMFRCWVCCLLLLLLALRRAGGRTAAPPTEKNNTAEQQSTISTAVVVFRGTISYTSSTHKNLHISLFLTTCFGPIHYGPP